MSPKLKIGYWGGRDTEKERQSNRQLPMAARHFKNRKEFKMANIVWSLLVR